jgi:hypothetical protein
MQCAALPAPSNKQFVEMLLGVSQTSPTNNNNGQLQCCLSAQRPKPI